MIKYCILLHICWGYSAKQVRDIIKDSEPRYGNLRYNFLEEICHQPEVWLKDGTVFFVYDTEVYKTFQRIWNLPKYLRYILSYIVYSYLTIFQEAKDE